MMLKIFCKEDFKVFHVKKTFQEILNTIFSSSDYLEFSDGKNFILGMKTPSNREVVCLYHQEEVDFLRKIRDNYKNIIAQTNRKNVLQKIHDLIETNNMLYNMIRTSSVKTNTQLKAFVKKTGNLSKRLQNVFIIGEDNKKTVKLFDNSKNVIVFSSFDEKYHSIISDIKKSKVLLFLNEKKIPYKKLKQLGLSNLTYKKETTKYIWAKNINIEEFVEENHK